MEALNAYRTVIWVSLPLVTAEYPDNAPYYLSLAKFDFDTGLQAGDEFNIKDWFFGENRSLRFTASAGIVRREIDILPSELDPQTGQRMYVFQISLYAEIADKEQVLEVCKVLMDMNPGMFLESAS